MLRRKDRILISALELLEKEGVTGITTKKLAQMQNVTEPALYRQYKSKHHILRRIVEEYAFYDDRIINTICEKDLKGKEALLFFVNIYSELYENYSELTTILFSFDLYYYSEDTKQIMDDILKKRHGFLTQLIDESDDINKKKFSSEELADMIDGIFMSQIFKWRMAKKTYQLKKELILMIHKMIN